MYKQGLDLGLYTKDLKWVEWRFLMKKY
jgi:hypothetical protein